jgi:hypothetical protein
LNFSIIFQVELDRGVCLCLLGQRIELHQRFRVLGPVQQIYAIDRQSKDLLLYHEAAIYLDGFIISNIFDDSLRGEPPSHSPHPIDPKVFASLCLFSSQTSGKHKIILAIELGSKISPQKLNGMADILELKLTGIANRKFIVVCIYLVSSQDYISD